MFLFILLILSLMGFFVGVEFEYGWRRCQSLYSLAFSFLCRYQRWLCQSYQVILTLYGLLRETLKVSFNW